MVRAELPKAASPVAAVAAASPPPAVASDPREAGLPELGGTVASLAGPRTAAPGLARGGASVSAPRAEGATRKAPPPEAEVAAAMSQPRPPSVRAFAPPPPLPALVVVLSTIASLGLACAAGWAPVFVHRYRLDYRTAKATTIPVSP